MKDIYELLNEADIDFNDVEDMNVDELERKRGKRKLMNSIKVKGRKKKKIAVTAASLAIVGLISGTMINSTWAADVPIIGDMLQRIFINNNPEFENYINVIGKTSSYEGVDITFENAVADNNSLLISYVVKDNNKPIPLYVDVLSPTMEIKVNGENMNMSGGACGEKIDDNTVRILRTVHWNFEKLPDKLDIEISDEECNMDIKFSMDTKEIESNTKIQEVNKELNIDNKKWSLENITVSPVMTNVKYYIENDNEYAPFYSFLIFDQDGNELEWKGGKSSMKGTDDYVEGRVDYNFNYVSRENITKLTFIPIKSAHEENPHILSSQKVNVDNFKPISFKITDDISLIVEKLDVDGSRITVEYNYYYNGKKISSLDGGNLFVKGDGVSRIEDDDGWNVEVYNIGENREIEIGCYDTKTNNIFEDKAFTIDIK